MRTKQILSLSFIAVFSFTAPGCLLVGAVAAGAYASSVSDEDKKAFHSNNMEREKNGLKPLTYEEWDLARPKDPAAQKSDVGNSSRD